MLRFTRNRILLGISMLSIAALFAYFQQTLFHRQFKRVSSSKVEAHSFSENPPLKHLILGEEVVENKEIFIIGDVHGCLDELDELLRLAQAEVKNKTLLPIFVGDLTNKGPKNLATLRRIRKMDAYAVRGNHDDAIVKRCLKYIEDKGYELPEKLHWTKELDVNDLRYLRDLPYTIRIPSKSVIIVHAGIVPGLSLENHDTSIFITMRNLYTENGILKPYEHLDKGEAWASLWQGPEHVYFGHDARRKLQQYQYATGLDTGGLYGFALTGILLNQQKLLQVKAKKIYWSAK